MYLCVYDFPLRVYGLEVLPIQRQFSRSSIFMFQDGGSGMDAAVKKNLDAEIKKMANRCVPDVL